MVLDSLGLVSYWRLGERDGWVAVDSAGAACGRYENVGLGVPGALTGDADTAAAFDGTRSAVSVGPTAELSFPGRSEFTLAAWIRPSEVPRDNARIISAVLSRYDGLHGYELVLTPRLGITFNRYAGAAVDHVVTAPTVGLNQWSHVVAIYNGQRVSVYVDGQAVAGVEAQLDLRPFPHGLDIGRRCGVPRSATFHGAIDEVAVWRRSLPDEEVRRHHSAGTSPAARRDRGSHDDELGARRVAELYERTAAVSLQRELWTDPGCYQAGYTLMIPLYAAFLLERGRWIEQFDDHAARLVAAAAAGHFRGQDASARLQYLYLWSRYITLSARRGRTGDTLEALTELVLAEFDEPWSSRRASLEDVLAQEPVELARRRAIDGDALLTVGIAADLLSSGLVRDPMALGQLAEARATALRVFASEIRWRDDGGWLLQPGAWCDHEDYLYAGRDRVADDTGGAPIPDIAPSTSFAQRLPVILESLREAVHEESAAWFVDGLSAGLERQLAQHVLVEPGDAFPAFRMTNYMDGRNGVYGSTTWYGPYGLSGALTTGWWSRLPGARVRRAYRRLAQRFPLSEAVWNTYCGPLDNRLGLPVRADNVEDGAELRELLVRLAAMLPGP